MSDETTRARLARLGPARDHLRRADPVMQHLVDAHPEFDPREWLETLPELDAFATLVFQVIGQQLSVKATRRLLERLQEQFSGRMPTPEEALSADPHALRAAGLSHRKVRTIRTLATEFVENRITDKALRSMSDEEIEDQLTALPGIGPWTVHGFLIIALDRDDVVLPGDLALRKAIQRHYDLDHLPTQDEVLRIAEPWRPYRTLASAYLFSTAFDQQT